MAFGPIPTDSGTANTLGENIAWGCFVGAILTLGIIDYVRRRKRVRLLRNHSERFGWQWRGEEIPWDFPLRDLVGAYEQPVKVTNAFSGKRGVIEFLALDCMIGQGKSKTTLSMIAARADRNPFGAEKWSSECRVVHAENWFAVQREQRMWGLSGYRILSAEETLALIESIG